mgnify:CR=1 FL=1
MKYLLLLLIILIPFHADAAWKIILGGELNSATDGVEVTTNSAPLAVSTTQKHSGANSYRVNAGAGFQRQVIYTANQTATSTLRVWYYPVARPNANTQFLRYSTTGNVSVGNITMITNGTLVLLKSDGTQIGSASAALPLNQWSCVELSTDSSSATGQLEGRVNGVRFARGANSNQGSWARVLWGNITGAQTTNDGYFDDIAVVDARAPDYAGCGSTVFLQPNAAGDANAWLDTSGSAGTSNNYTLVNEIPPDDATSMVQNGILNSEDLYNFSDSGLQTYDTINAFGIGTRHRNNTADAVTAFQIEWEASSGGTKANSVSLVPNSTTWTSYGTSANTGDTFKFSTTTTTTGAALTSTIMDSMQAGYIDSVLNVNRVQITSIWVYVDYTAGTPPPSTGGTQFFIFE